MGHLFYFGDESQESCDSMQALASSALCACSLLHFGSIYLRLRVSTVSAVRTSQVEHEESRSSILLLFPITKPKSSVIRTVTTPSARAAPAAAAAALRHVAMRALDGIQMEAFVEKDRRPLQLASLRWRCLFFHLSLDLWQPSHPRALIS